MSLPDIVAYGLGQIPRSGCLRALQWHKRTGGPFLLDGRYIDDYKL